jgi:hypothetical protein
MTQSSIDPYNSPPSNTPFQILALVLSVGMHFVIASNLGLFDRLIPVPVKPVGGTVKAVDLTASEQSRVPEAAKAKPLPINPIQAGAEQATQAIPNASSPGVLSGNAPKTNNRTSSKTPQTPASSNPQTNKLGILPKPSNTVKRSDPKYRVDQNNKFPGIQKKSDGSADNQDQSATSRRTRKTNDEQPGNTNPDQPSSPTKTPTTGGSADSSGEKKPPDQKQIPRDTKNKVTQELQEKIKTLQQQIGNSRVDNSIALTQQRYSGRKPSCSKEEDGYVVISIALDNQSKSVGNIPIVFSPFMDAPSPSNSLMQILLQEADRLALVKHSQRTVEQKKKDEGISVIYPIPFGLSKKDCP